MVFMTTQFITVGILMLLSAMMPGPDFFMVVQNTVRHSRLAGILTALGIGCAILVHISYCILGLALVISHSVFLFNIIKYIGATYLIYLGLNALLYSHPVSVTNRKYLPQQKKYSNFVAFKQGFLCNLLNPKATLFFLALFTSIIKPETPKAYELAYAIEMFMITTAWFVLLALIISHPKVVGVLNRVEKYISKIFGIFLIGFGIALALLKI